MKKNISLPDSCMFNSCKNLISLSFQFTHCGFNVHVCVQEHKPSKRKCDLYSKYLTELESYELTLSKPIFLPTEYPQL
jgi:hypothetical protein